MAANMHFNVPGTIIAVHQQDALYVSRVLRRKKKLDKQVAVVIKEKQEHFLEVTDALADIEIRCDAVKSYVEDFLKDKSEVKMFEGRLQKVLKLLQDTRSTDNAPSKINKDGPYSLYEMKVYYSKVLFKVESLQTLAEKVVDDKNTASAQPKKLKNNQANTPSLPSLTLKLDMIILEMRNTLELASTIINIVETHQKELAAFAAKVEIEDRKDFYLIGVNHATMHDWLDATQRAVYDKNLPYLTASQLANPAFERPVEKKNAVVQIRSLEQHTASVKNIQTRLEKIISVSNDFLGKLMDQATGLLWTEALEQVEHLLTENLFPDMPAAAAAGRPQADEPQADPSQTDQPQAEPSQADQPQADPSQADQPQAEPSQADQLQADPSQADQPQADPSQADQPQADPSQADQPHTNPSQADQPQAGPSHVGQPQAGPSNVGQPKAGPSHVRQPQAGPSHVRQPQAGPSHVRQPQAVSSHEGQPQAGPSHVRQPQAGPSHVGQPKAGPSHVRQPQAGPSNERQPQAGPSHVRQPQAGPSHLSQPQSGPSHVHQPQAGPSQTDQPQASPSQTDQPQASPSQTDQPQASPSQTDQPQASPSQTDQPQAGSSQTDQSQAVPSQADQLQAGPLQAGQPQQTANSSGSVLD